MINQGVGINQLHIIAATYYAINQEVPYFKQILIYKLLRHVFDFVKTKAAWIGKKEEDKKLTSLSLLFRLKSKE